MLDSLELFIILVLIIPCIFFIENLLFGWKLKEVKKRIIYLVIICLILFIFAVIKKTLQVKKEDRNYFIINE